MSTFDHVADAWTVGAEEPGGDLVDEQVIIHVGFGHGVTGDGSEFVGRELRIGCEFHTGTYDRRRA